MCWVTYRPVGPGAYHLLFCYMCVYLKIVNAQVTMIKKLTYLLTCSFEIFSQWHDTFSITIRHNSYKQSFKTIISTQHCHSIYWENKSVLVVDTWGNITGSALGLPLRRHLAAGTINTTLYVSWVLVIDHETTVEWEQVEESINSLPKGNAGGVDGLQLEHLIYACRPLSVSTFSSVPLLNIIQANV